LLLEAEFSFLTTSGVTSIMGTQKLKC
jgi:hypothetical protein